MANKTEKIMLSFEPDTYANLQAVAALERKKVTTLLIELAQEKITSMRAKIDAFRKLQAE